MAVYGVMMGQGVTANLTSNTLYTGSITDAAGEHLQSCSAVAFFNATTHEAGLYHFPAGSINTDIHSQKILQQIVKKVEPKRAWIAFGTSMSLFRKMGYNAMDTQDLAAAEEHEQLRAYVMKLLIGEARLSRQPAKRGNASLSWNQKNNQPVFPGDALTDENYKSSITNLSEKSAGTSRTGDEVYTVYGKNLNLTPIASTSTAGRVKKLFSRSSST